jgi:nucleoside-diphosphate-sugar epimerase
MPGHSNAVVTGAAGFIGSHLCERLLADGWAVLGIDCLTPFYSRSQKERNLDGLRSYPGFRFEPMDLRSGELRSILHDGDVVFHLAGQPGVRPSWADGFAEYAEHNLLVTQRLLEAVSAVEIGRFVFSSSSSVYGNADEYPCTEGTLPQPFSPYGVTKLAAEHLCRLYADNRGVPSVSLRYFTVYGPRQRPDMAFHRMISSALSGEPFPVYGSGTQVRDFTFVSDVVAATIAAGVVDVAPGTVMNVAGGASVSLTEAMETLAAIVGSEIPVEHLPTPPGDVHATGGSIQRAEATLNWAPQVDLEEGLSAQFGWHVEQSGRSGGIHLG